MILTPMKLLVIASLRLAAASGAMSFVDGAAMYESNDIIAYLSKTFDVDHVDSSEKNDAAPAGGSCTIGGGCSF